MANRTWTKAQLKSELGELTQLLHRAERESRGHPDDMLAQRLLKQLIRRRQAQIDTFEPPAGFECVAACSPDCEPGTVCRDN